MFISLVWNPMRNGPARRDSGHAPIVRPSRYNSYFITAVYHFGVHQAFTSCFPPALHPAARPVENKRLNRMNVKIMDKLQKDTQRLKNTSLLKYKNLNKRRCESENFRLARDLLRNRFLSKIKSENFFH